MGTFLLSIVFSMFPIVLWGYLFSYADNSKFSGLRFLLGMITGAVGVLPIAYSKEIAEFFGNSPIFLFISTKVSSISDLSFSLLVAYCLPIFLVSIIGVFLMFRIFQKYIWAISIALGSILAYGVFYVAILYVGWPFISETGLDLSLMDITLKGFLAIGLAYAFVAGVEEAVKHMALYPLLNDSVSKWSIALAATFGALGFAFLENALYLNNIASISGFSSGAFITTLFSRSIVSLLLHVFAALLVSFWLTHLLTLPSNKKIPLFFSYFLSGVFVHALFNVSLTYGKTGIIALYAVIGYFFFTKVFFDERAGV